jgi:hypothetical protein
MSADEIRNFIDQFDLSQRSERYAIMYKLHQMYIEKDLNQLFTNNI